VTQIRHSASVCAASCAIFHITVENYMLDNFTNACIIWFLNFLGTKTCRPLMCFEEKCT
jgi:hypothetical protein